MYSDFFTYSFPFFPFFLPFFSLKDSLRDISLHRQVEDVLMLYRIKLLLYRVLGNQFVSWNLLLVIGYLGK